MDHKSTEVKKDMEHGLQESDRRSEAVGSGGSSRQRPPDVDQMHEEEGLARYMLESNRNAFKIRIISLLIQMNSPTVRGDFIHGRFGSNINASILPSLDQIRWVLIPRWQSEGSCSIRFKEASEHMDRLLKRSNAVFVLEPTTETAQSYSHWMCILELIAGSDYWKRIPANERCVHSFDDSKFQSVETKYSTPESKMPLNLSKQLSTKSNKSSKHSKTISKVKIEEVILSESSSSSSSCEESSESTTSSDDSSDKYRKRSRRKTKRRHYAHDKEVVKPPMFQPNGKQSLKEFFKTFEAYFHNKYRGDKFDRSQLLGTFLSGELLQVYNAQGGRDLDYNAMKVEIEKHYKKRKVGSRTYWRKQLGEAVPEDDEPFDIFGMRLGKLAELAYPSDEKECAWQLRSQFLKNIPDSFVAEIKSTERVNKATGKGKSKYLPFTAIAEIAKDLQRSQSKRATVMWTTSLSNDKTNHQNNQARHNSRGTSNQFQQREPIQSPKKSDSGQGSRLNNLPNNKANGNSRNREFSNRSPVHDSKPRRSVRRYCEFCRRDGHTESECWRKAKLCLICGQDHPMEKCNKYDPERVRSKFSTSNSNNHLN